MLYRCFRRECTASVVVTGPLVQGVCYLCTCGHRNKYCEVCRGFFERAFAELEPEANTRGGLHYRDHKPRQNLSHKILYKESGMNGWSRHSCACISTLIVRWVYHSQAILTFARVRGQLQPVITFS